MSRIIEEPEPSDLEPLSWLKLPKLIELTIPPSLMEDNARKAEELYNSAFYYGNFSREEWIERMKTYLNIASQRGYDLR